MDCCVCQDFQWDDGDTISDLIGIRRVDSKDIVYENKKKTTKVSPGFLVEQNLNLTCYLPVLYLFI